MQQSSKPNPGNGLASASLLAREVADLHREKSELLEENASLKKGLEFLLAGSSRRARTRAIALARLMSNEERRG